MYAQLKQSWNALIGEGADFEVATVDVRGLPMHVVKNALPSLREVWLASSQFAERE